MGLDAWSWGWTWPPLDSATLMFSIAVVAVMSAAVAFSAARSLGTGHLGTLEWSKSMLAAAGAVLLFYLRGHAPPVLTFVAANALVLASPVYMLHAYARFFELHVPRVLIGSACGAALGCVMGNYWFAVPYAVAVVAVCAVLALLFGLHSAMLMWRDVRRSPFSTWLSAMSAAALAVAFAMRAVLALEDNATAPTANGTSQAFMLVVASLFVMATSLGFLTMVHQRVRSEAVDKLRRDGLTGLYTRTAFFEAANTAMSGGGQFSAVMLDLDHFKQINDSYGHVAGDTTLAHAARLVANSARLTDLVGRYGGEEICVLLPGCGEREAEQFAQRVVQEAGQQAARLADGLRIGYTFSAGFATTDGNESLEALLHRADMALYAAKRGGRNRVAAALSHSQTPTPAY